MAAKREFAVVRVLSSIENATNFYEILGVEEKADASVIRKKYRSLASAIHPDKCTEDNATTCFARVNEAKTTLLSPAKRKRYDRDVLPKTKPAVPKFRAGAPIPVARPKPAPVPKPAAREVPKFRAGAPIPVPRPKQSAAAPTSYPAAHKPAARTVPRPAARSAPKPAARAVPKPAARAAPKPSARPAAKGDGIRVKGDGIKVTGGSAPNPMKPPKKKSSWLSFGSKPKASKPKDDGIRVRGAKPLPDDGIRVRAPRALPSDGIRVSPVPHKRARHA